MDALFTNRYTATRGSKKTKKFSILNRLYHNETKNTAESAACGSDHYLLRTKINFPTRRQHSKAQIQTDTQKNARSEEQKYIIRLKE